MMEAYSIDNVYVGFTSGTGGAWENNDIDHYIL
ncbi:hypothetical protein B0H42_004877 [Clostridium saccharobutylicum]|nr:hypothetical protein [Clostridium saccharobutylicum]